jgi:ribosomal protein S18 acetylase RimI-like enzyme
MMLSMSKILRMRKDLSPPNVAMAVGGWQIRLAGAGWDVDRWLELRAAAFQALTAGGRPWTRDDYSREFAGKQLWLAVLTGGERRRTKDQVIGAVALGRSGRPPQDRASLEWLMVHPAHRRQGIGQSLIAVVEQAAWDSGEREIVLETHADWRDAVRLYERCGYVPAR